MRRMFRVKVIYNTLSMCARSFTKTRPPRADSTPNTSLSAYRRAPSPKLLVWARHYACRGTHSWLFIIEGVVGV